MKKAGDWIFAAAAAAMAVCLALIGVKALIGRYDFLPEAYICLGCAPAFFGCVLYRALGGRKDG